MGAIIEARDLVKRFNDFTAVDHASFAVPEGVIFGFLDDRTTIAFAGLVEREFGGFTPPPDL